MRAGGCSVRTQCLTETHVEHHRPQRIVSVTPFFQLWTEALFLDAALQLVDAHSALLTTQQGRDMEHLAFDWILNAEKYVPAGNVDLTRLKERVRYFLGGRLFWGARERRAVGRAHAALGGRVEALGRGEVDATSVLGMAPCCAV